MRYRRARTKGGCYFFTVVTFGREKILTREDNVQLLRDGMRHVMKAHLFRIDAFVLLPDHLHCIWTLPAGDADFPLRWRLIKSDFTRRCKDKLTHAPSASRLRKKERAVWQRRFWEHQLRDEHDFTRHVEYIHYNPVRHKYVDSPKDWPFSSFHRYVRQGKYARTWGAGQDLIPPEINNFVGWVE
jgi:putative transposase